MTLARWPLFIAIALAGCGGSKHPPAQVAEEPISSDSPSSSAGSGGGSDDDASASDPSSGSSGGDDKGSDPPKTSACMGFEMDLLSALGQSSCEVPNAKPDDKPKDVKGSLVVTAMASSARVAPGGQVDIMVTFTNKSAGLLPLDFQIDPLPRFQVEAYSAKGNRRVDLPPGKQPALPKGMAPREPGTPSTARITLAANGKATVKLTWTATRMKWAPDKLKGTPPEQGYPKTPAGPLPKGKYNIRVLTPLIGVFEGVDHEVTAPKTMIEVN